MLSFKEFILQEGFLSGIKNFAGDVVKGALNPRYRRPSLDNIDLPIIGKNTRELKRSFDKYSGKNLVNKWTKGSRWNQWAKRKVGYYGQNNDIGKALRIGRQLSQGKIALPLTRALPKLSLKSWKPEEDV